MRDLPLKLTLDHRNVATKRLRVTLPAGNDRRRDKSQICTCDNQNLSQEQILSIFIRQRSTCYVNVNDCSRFNFIQRLREFSKYLGSMIFTLFKHRKELPL